MDGNANNNIRNKMPMMNGSATQSFHAQTSANNNIPPVWESTTSNSKKRPWSSHICNQQQPILPECNNNADQIMEDDGNCDQVSSSLSPCSSLGDIRSLKRLRIDEEGRATGDQQQRHETRIGDSIVPTQTPLPFHCQSQQCVSFQQSQQQQHRPGDISYSHRNPSLFRNSSDGTKQSCPNRGTTPCHMPPPTTDLKNGQERDRLCNNNSGSTENSTTNFNSLLGSLHMERRRRRLEEGGVVSSLSTSDSCRDQSSMNNSNGQKYPSLQSSQMQQQQQHHQQQQHQNRSSTSSRWKRQVHLQSNSQLY